MIGDDADGMACESRLTDDHVVGIERKEFDKVTIVHGRLNDLDHVIGSIAIVGYDCHEFGTVSVVRIS